MYYIPSVHLYIHMYIVDYLFRAHYILFEMQFSDIMCGDKAVKLYFEGEPEFSSMCFVFAVNFDVNDFYFSEEMIFFLNALIHILAFSGNDISFDIYLHIFHFLFFITILHNNMISIRVGLLRGLQTNITRCFTTNAGGFCHTYTYKYIKYSYDHTHPYNPILQL